MFLGRWLLTLRLGLCLVLVGTAIAVLHHDGRAARGAILLHSLAGCHDSSFLSSPNCSRSSGLFPTMLSYTPIIPSLSVSRNSGWVAHYVDPAGASRVSGLLIGIVRAGFTAETRRSRSSPGVLGALGGPLLRGVCRGHRSDPAVAESVWYSRRRHSLSSGPTRCPRSRCAHRSHERPFPILLCGQPRSGPVSVCHGLEPAHPHHRMVVLVP